MKLILFAQSEREVFYNFVELYRVEGFLRTSTSYIRLFNNNIMLYYLSISCLLIEVFFVATYSCYTRKLSKRRIEKIQIRKY